MNHGYGPKKKQLSKRREVRSNIPLQRVTAEIRIDATKEVVDSRVFLNDVTPEGLGCFVNSPFDKGEKVSLVLEQPKHIYLKGEVIWCQPYVKDTKVLRADPFNYRLGIKFLFDDAEEQNAIRAFCEELYKKPE